jgi:hypothetical protein
MNNWKYKGKDINSCEIATDSVGFVYLITNLNNNRKYIGRKLLTMASTETKLLKNGNKKKVKCRKESDWLNYHGSCKELKDDILKIGNDYFEREILLFCNSVSTLNYEEAYYQMINRVLESDEYYNSNIMIRAYKQNIKGKI